MPKGKYPNLNDILAVASKTLSMNAKKSQEYKQDQKKATHKSSSRKKLEAIKPKLVQQKSLKKKD